MKFINNSEKSIKVKKEPHGKEEENLPPVFVTIKPGECINANSDAFINGYKKDKLIPVMGPLEKVFEKAKLKKGPEYQERTAAKTSKAEQDSEKSDKEKK